jgi:hypothetical protein
MFVIINNICSVITATAKITVIYGDSERMSVAVKL